MKPDQAKKRKRMIQMLIIVGGLLCAIFLFKIIVGILADRYIKNQLEQKRVTVSTTKVKYAWWQPQLKASGSLRAIRGVNVTTELAGMVQSIYFTPGSLVEEGTILAQLNARSETALLHSLQANAELAKITYERDKLQYAVQAISKQVLDNDIANLKSLQAQVEQQAAIVAKKTIRAPFSGRLGISAINPGQYLNPGDKVTTLQTLNPIYSDFYVPQQEVIQLKVGQQVIITSDSYPKQTFKGKITTIDPLIDVSTRNGEIEATIENNNFKLIPGMFVSVSVITGTPEKRLTLPQAAISFNPYGEIVYLVKESKDKNNKSSLFVQQVFITTGETRGDQIAVLSGLKENDVVVTTGQLKLRNGTKIAINNTVTPANSADPLILENE